MYTHMYTYIANSQSATERPIFVINVITWNKSPYANPRCMKQQNSCQTNQSTITDVPHIPTVSVCD